MKIFICAHPNLAGVGMLGISNWFNQVMQHIWFQFEWTHFLPGEQLTRLLIYDAKLGMRRAWLAS
jgi:hypothetical protein